MILDWFPSRPRLPSMNRAGENLNLDAVKKQITATRAAHGQ